MSDGAHAGLAGKLLRSLSLVGTLCRISKSPSGPGALTMSPVDAVMDDDGVHGQPQSRGIVSG